MTRLHSEKTHLKSFAVDIENRLAGIKVISVFIKMFTQRDKSLLYRGSGNASVADLCVNVFKFTLFRRSCLKGQSAAQQPKVLNVGSKQSQCSKILKQKLRTNVTD